MMNYKERILNEGLKINFVAKKIGVKPQTLNIYLSTAVTGRKMPKKIADDLDDFLRKYEQIKIDIETRNKVLKEFKSGDDISSGLIQKRCSVRYFTALRTLELLIEQNLVSKNKLEGSYKFI